MKKPASFTKLTDLTPTERAANTKYAAFLEKKAQRNKADRAKKAAKVIELAQKVKQSNRTIDYTREEWLMTAIQLFRPIFAERGYIIPEKVKATVGYPSNGGRGKVIGECHCCTASAGGFHEIFIRPDLADEQRILGVLVHELIHAAIGVEHKHNPRFKKAMLALCLEGKPTATTEGEPFRRMVLPVLSELGPIPHKALSLNGKKKQKTRMLKVECPCCSFKFRSAKQPLLDIASTDEKGLFVQCPSPICGVAIVEGGKPLPTRIYLDIEQEGDGDEEE
jgi:hypothetical protein